MESSLGKAEAPPPADVSRMAKIQLCVPLPKKGVK